jgi:hypothetical protein
MQTTRSVRKNRAIPSRASPLPQDCAAACRCPCGSWLACDANNAVTQKKQGDTIASKPAPTRLRSPLAGALVGAGLPAMQTTRSVRKNRAISSRASPLPQGLRSRLKVALVGAGLPAMQTTRSVRKNRAISSRASPLPQGPCEVACMWCRTCGSWLACDANNAVSQEKPGDIIASKPAPTRTAKPLAGALVGAGLPAMRTTRSVRKNRAIPSRASPLPQDCEAACRCPCGSWLACDANDAVSQEKQGDTLASKPAPTGRRSRLQVPLWELACLRCERRGQSGKIGRYLREQARSHKDGCKPLACGCRPVGAGLPAMQTTRSLRKDSIDTIASKPAPTGRRSRLKVPLWELACLRCEQRGQSGKTGRYPREQARSHRTAKPLAGAVVGFHD